MVSGWGIGVNLPFSGAKAAGGHDGCLVGEHGLITQNTKHIAHHQTYESESEKLMIDGTRGGEAEAVGGGGRNGTEWNGRG